VFHAQFVQALTGAANAYTGAGAANAAPLQSVVQDALDLVHAPGLSGASRGAAADVALIMGPSGFPVPPPTYLNAANKLYVQFLDAGATPVLLTTPEGLYPITGTSSLKLNNSVSQGVATLNNATLQQLATPGVNHVDVFG
jgi:hypothetical protein